MAAPTRRRRLWDRLKAPKQLPKRKLPGYIAFTKQALGLLSRDKGLFVRLFLLTSFIALLLFGVTQQEQYSTAADTIKKFSEEAAGKGIGAEVQFGVLLATAATGGLNTTLSETQKVYLIFFYLLVSLATIWLLRHRMAETAVTVRDGLYNAGGPIVTTILLSFVGIFQLLPMALGVIIYSAATTSGLLQGWFELALFATGALALSVLSLYWVSSTLFAIIIATNPGTYPMPALKAARSIVAGQRLTIVTRLVWLVFLLVVLWAVVLVPAVLLDSWVSQQFLPIVVLSVQALTSFSIIFAVTYIYLLYRKMIDESAN